MNYFQTFETPEKKILLRGLKLVDTEKSDITNECFHCRIKVGLYIVQVFIDCRQISRCKYVLKSMNNKPKPKKMTCTNFQTLSVAFSNQTAPVF